MAQISKTVETPFGSMQMTVSETMVNFETGPVRDATITVNGVKYRYAGWLTFHNEIWQTITMDRHPWKSRADTRPSDAAAAKVKKWCLEFFAEWKTSGDGKQAAWDLTLATLREEHDSAEREWREHSDKAEAARKLHNELTDKIAEHKATKP